MTGAPVAQGLSGAATAAGIFATVVGSLIGLLTWLATRKSARGTDLERLQGSLSAWARETIDDLRSELQAEEQRRHAEVAQSEARCRVMVEQLRAEGELRAEEQRRYFETRLAEAEARADWWKARALGRTDPDATPPPDARERP